MERGPGFWIISYSLGLVAVFVVFLVLTARPELGDATAAAGENAAQVSAESVREAYKALGTAVDAVRARYGF